MSEDAGTEKINFSKFFGSFFQALPWIKDLRTYIGLAIVIFVACLIWRVFTRDTQSQTQMLKVYPFSFSHITYSPQQQQKQEIKKKAWWMPSPFVEIYGVAEKGSDWSRTGVGTKVGLRWDF